MLGWDVNYHVAWGAVTFIVLIIATVLAFRHYGQQSNIFKVGIAAIADYVLQIILGFVALNVTVNTGLTIVIHLTNAFVLGVFTTYFISFADSADRTGAILHTATVKPLGS